MCGGGGGSQPSQTTQIQQLPMAARPFLYGGDGRAGLLPQAYELSQQPLNLPDFMVAERTPTQVAAEQMAREARGGFEPYLRAAGALTGQGVMATEQAGRLSQQELGASQAERQAARDALGLGLMGTTGAGVAGMSAAERGIAGLAGTGAEYDPNSVQRFMNPFEQQVIDMAMGDIARSGQMQLNEARSQAARAGAFGGARAGLVESEIGRNILGEQARTAAGLRQEGFESASSRSQAAFEAARQRQQQAASTTGQLGLSGAQAGLSAAGQAAGIGNQFGQIGTSFGQLGQQAAGQQAVFGQGLGALGAQMAGFGQQRQGQQLQDINTALTMGGQQQQQQQAILDAARQNQYQQTMSPYQSLGFFSDIFQGAPTGTSSVVQQQQPGPNPASQVAGLGIGAYGLMKSGLFGI